MYKGSRSQTSNVDVKIFCLYFRRQPRDGYILAETCSLLCAYFVHISCVWTERIISLDIL